MSTPTSTPGATGGDGGPTGASPYQSRRVDGTIVTTPLGSVAHLHAQRAPARPERVPQPPHLGRRVLGEGLGEVLRQQRLALARDDRLAEQRGTQGARRQLDTLERSQRHCRGRHGCHGPDDDAVTVGHPEVLGEQRVDHAQVALGLPVEVPGEGSGDATAVAAQLDRFPHPHAEERHRLGMHATDITPGVDSVDDLGHEREAAR